MAAKSQQWDGVTGGATLGQRGLLLLFRFVHIRVLYAVMAAVVPFYMLFRIKGYLPIYHYFRRHFGASRWQAFSRTYRNHYLFGQCLLDRFAVYAGKGNRFELLFTGNGRFTELLSKPGGFIMAGSHTGNFELSGYLLKQDVKRIRPLVFGGESAEIMAQRARVLGGNNIDMIPVGSDFSHVFAISEAFTAGDIVSMPCDRSLGSPKTVECSFLDGKADFPLGPFMLAAQFEAPILAIFVMKERRQTYHIYVKPVEPAETGGNTRQRAARLATAYARLLEDVVRQYPEQWFNYFEFWKE
jgi:predicted LPLAT superfamily acyltransferase